MESSKEFQGHRGPADRVRDEGTIERVYGEGSEFSGHVVLSFANVFVPCTIEASNLTKAGVSLKVGEKFTAEVKVDADEELSVEPSDFRNKSTGSESRVTRKNYSPTTKLFFGNSTDKF